MTKLLAAAIEPRREAAREARKLIADVDGPELATVLEDVALLVSELVTNSFRYGGLREGERISLSLTHEGDSLRAEITDPGRGPTEPKPRSPTHDGGWGLQIVDKKADRWGVDRRKEGTVVWFEIDLDGSDV